MGDEEVRQAEQNKTNLAQKKVAKSDLAKAPTNNKEDEDKQKTESREEKKKQTLKERVQQKVGKSKKEETDSVDYEREYIVPLRKEFKKVPEYKRANKAVKALKEFIARHMKIYDRDLRKVKIDILVNNEIRFRGMKKPLHKIKVKAIKYKSGKVEVKLVNLPKHIEFELARKAKKQAAKAEKEKANAKQKVMQEAIAKAKAEKEKAESGKEDNKEEKEKMVSSQQATQKLEKAQAKIAKQTSVKQAKVTQRKALKK